MKPASIFSAKTFVIIISILIPYLHAGLILAAGAPKIVEFSIPTSLSIPVAITSADGAVWFTEIMGNKIGRLDPTTNKITEYQVSTSNNGPVGIATGPDGALWFTEIRNTIGRIDPTTHAITVYPSTNVFGQFAGITSGPDGGLWFTVFFGSQIGRIDPTTHDFTGYSPPASSLAVQALRSVLTAPSGMPGMDSAS